ncbi:hypothetical protein VKT23_004878 [Stygiomarasmius scandens]|uniref:Prolyl 4-hydroxylase alpha subunit Fe(2+) 2OG dioxygenase domain-containing protein n=1 Tax=Marasmiellus scandens TaxID=2682957 RepID=A0ABR1JXZ2_9AGAR
MLAKADNPELDDCIDHLQLGPPLSSNTSSPLSSPPDSPQHSISQLPPSILAISSQESSPLSSPLSSPPISPQLSSSELPLSTSAGLSTSTGIYIPPSTGIAIPDIAPAMSASLSTGNPIPEPANQSKLPSTPRKTRRSRKKKTSSKPPTPSPQKKRTAAAHGRRQKKRKLSGQHGNNAAQTNTVSRLIREGHPIIIDWDCLPAISMSSGYLGRDWVEGPRKVWALDELVGPTSKFQFHLIRWNGRTSLPIVDRNGKIFVVLVARPPNDETWESVHKDAAQLLEKLGPRVTPQHCDELSRRGVWIYISVGYSFGGGQKFPKLFNQLPKNQLVLDELLSSTCFQRISGHVSSAFAAWAPKLHQLYTSTLQQYATEDPSFRPNFPRTAFAAATFNFDNQTETVEHLDYFNYIFGWCGVTALGSFDYTKGGHMILWDLGLVIEFPPGCSILLPSSYIRHSNTAISPGEKRYSFTEYTAGGLFRYNDDGMRTRASMSPYERQQREKQAKDRVHEGVELYSTLDELVASLSLD